MNKNMINNKKLNTEGKVSRIIAVMLVAVFAITALIGVNTSSKAGTFDNVTGITYTISFNTNGGSEVADVTMDDINDVINLSNISTKEGCYISSYTVYLPYISGTQKIVCGSSEQGKFSVATDLSGVTSLGYSEFDAWYSKYITYNAGKITTKFLIKLDWKDANGTNNNASNNTNTSTNTNSTTETNTKSNSSSDNSLNYKVPIHVSFETNINKSIPDTEVNYGDRLDIGLINVEGYDLDKVQVFYIDSNGQQSASTVLSENAIHNTESGWTYIIEHSDFLTWNRQRNNPQGRYKLKLDYVKSIETYTIDYELNGGTNNSKNPDTYSWKNDYRLCFNGLTDYGIALQEPHKERYEFAGWYLKDEGFELPEYYTKKRTDLGYDVLWIYPNIRHDITLVAKWELKGYSLKQPLVDLDNVKVPRYVPMTSKVIKSTSLAYQRVNYVSNCFQVNKKHELIYASTVGDPDWYESAYIDLSNVVGCIYPKKQDYYDKLTEKGKIYPPDIEKDFPGIINKAAKKGHFCGVYMNDDGVKVSGYQIRYSTKKNITSDKKMKVKNQRIHTHMSCPATLFKVIPQGKKVKTYYFQIRPYAVYYEDTFNKKDKRTFYGDWTKVYSTKKLKTSCYY